MLAHFLGKAHETPGSRARPSYWSAPDGTRVAKITTNDKTFVVSIDKRVAPDFGDFLVSQLDGLYAAHANLGKES